MLNVEKYKDEILKYAGYQHSLMCLIYENIMKKNDCTGCCSKCKRETIKWLTSEYEEPILTEEEKVIIKNILKAFEPFGKKLSYIAKKECYSNTRKHYLVFRYKNDSLCTLDFNNDELFEGMESDVDYTLEDLGL